MLKTNQIFINALIENILQKDDEAAFATLFKLFYPKLVDFSIRIVRSKNYGEEIVSNVFVNIWQTRKSIGKINNVQAYLYSSVKNSSLNFIKTKRLSAESLPDNHETNIKYFADSALNPERELEMKEMLEQLSAAIETLPPQCKAIFRLIKEDGLKYKEVADIFHISPRTVETQLVRALKRLESVMASHLEKKKDIKATFLRIAKCMLILSV